MDVETIKQRLEALGGELKSPLTEWERNFVSDMREKVKKGETLSPGMVAKLVQIHEERAV